MEISDDLPSEFDFDFLFKIVIIGDVKTGKSSFLQLLLNEPPARLSVPTIGVDFRTLYMSHNSQTIKLQIWDASGHERFAPITNAYYRGSDAVIYFFDLTNRESFNHLDNWYESFNQKAKKGALSLLLGNKRDLVNDRKITESEGWELGMRKGVVDYREVSAREGTEGECKEAIIGLVDRLVNVREMGDHKGCILKNYEFKYESKCF